MKLMKFSFPLFLYIFTSVINKTEATTKIKFEDVDLLYVNGEFVDENSFEISVNYINDIYNTLKCKAIVIKKFPEDTRVLLKAYGYAFGNYRVPTGISIDVSICDLKTKPILIAPFITAIGGDLDKCGPDVGEYGNESFIPVDPSMLPNLFPSNKYRLDVEVGNRVMKIVKVQFFVSITS